MNPWVPFDADDDEIAALHIVREGIPDTLRPVLLGWMQDRLPRMGGGWVTFDIIDTLQTALRINFNLGTKPYIEPSTLIERIAQLGEKQTVRVLDFVVSWSDAPAAPYFYHPAEIENLRYHLDASSSTYEVHLSEQQSWRIRRRVPEGVEEAVQVAIDQQPTAGRHLANAWRAAWGLEPNESFAMTEAIRAVDAACGPVVIPSDKKPNMFKAVKVLRDQSGWGLAFENSDGYPDHLEVLIGMMETLAKAQPDRHGGQKPTALEAQGHVQLAATLVHWFTSGVVVRTVS